MALSDAEASIVSPFTGKSKSVRCVVDLLLEGRATLHTSFAMYKFLVANGIILSLTKMAILYYGCVGVGRWGSHAIRHNPEGPEREEFSFRPRGSMSLCINDHRSPTKHT